MRLNATAITSLPLRWRWLVPAILLVAVFHWTAGPALDRAFHDAASRHPLRPSPIPGDSALVLIDEQTLASLGAQGLRWPYPRSAFAQLILALHQAGAARVVMDFTFFEESDEDAVLNAVATVTVNTVLARTQERPPVFWPREFVTGHPRYFNLPRTGLAEFPADPDGVARRYPAAGSLAGAATGTEVSGGGLLRWRGNLEQIRARGVPVLAAAPYILAGRPLLEGLLGAAPDLDQDLDRFAAAVRGAPELKGALADAVRGRVVFVGTSAAGTFDLKPLPVGRIEPGLLLHWTAWANLREGGFVAAAPDWLVALLSAAIASLVFVFGRHHQGIIVPISTALGLGVLVIGAAYAGLSLGWFLPPATPAAALLLALLGLLAERFWREQARKREIQSMFGAYVDPAVVADLVRNPSSIRLGGERREATVFFSDLVGFTDLSEKLRDQPERMVEVVNAYLEETSNCLLNHGAYVDKYIGDAVMAVFGVPQPLPGHALAACRAALEAQAAIAGINARYAASAGVKLAVRIGLNTGEMIAGNVGSSRKRNYTVMGDAVNLSSRLEGANKAFGTQILLGHETARLVQDVMATRPLTRLRVKGKAVAVEVHALHGPRDTLPSAERDFLRHYLDGYAALERHTFAEAAAAFARACAIMPNDKTARHWLGEATAFAARPPSPDWEPLLALESK